MAQLIKVRHCGSNEAGSFWERNPDHPGGEVFVSAGWEGEVAATPMALAAIKDGRLIGVGEKAKAALAGELDPETDDKPVEGEGLRPMHERMLLGEGAVVETEAEARRAVKEQRKAMAAEAIPAPETEKAAKG